MKHLNFLITRWKGYDGKLLNHQTNSFVTQIVHFYYRKKCKRCNYKPFDLLLIIPNLNKTMHTAISSMKQHLKSYLPGDTHFFEFQGLESVECSLPETTNTKFDFVFLHWKIIVCRCYLSTACIHFFPLCGDND